MPFTGFVPAEHGFHFANDFVNRLALGPVRITTRGRCGGMVYAALDCYTHGLPIPADTILPADGTPLADYLYARQLRSLRDMGFAFVVRVANLFVPKCERFARALCRGGPFEKLTTCVDAGRPVVLGLIGVTTKHDAHHQVLGIGYDRVGPDVADVRVHTYDPNTPDEIVTLVPDPENSCFQSSNGRTWRTFFVYESFQPLDPATVAGPLAAIQLRRGGEL